jgi:type VI secretion system protein ImpE
VVYVPALYHGSHADPKESVRLGRETEYRGSETEPYRGVGQREFLIGQEEKAIMTVTKVEFKK